MEKLLMQLLDKAKTSKIYFRVLKSAAVKCQEFELASNLREIELQTFPETGETKEAKDRAKKLNLVFRMVEMNISENLCWLIEQTLKEESIKGGEFSMDDAVRLRFKMKELFECDD